MKFPEYIENHEGKKYCVLIGELDKVLFNEDQCSGCSIKDRCTILFEIYKNCPGDWHSLNAEGFFSEDWTNEKDKYERKAMRGVSKVCGLALTYGGSSYTLSSNMKCSQDLAQDRIDAFFAKLTTLNQYMINTKRHVLETGQVFNLFGRRRDMSKWAFSKAATYKQRRRDAGYAERTGLNHPIQSTSAEILKIAMIRVDEWIEKQGLNPLYGTHPPYHIDLKQTTYRDFLVHMLTSVHDELDYYLREDQFEELIPEIYQIMQIKDVMQSFELGFDLELDVEYSDSRAFTSSKLYPAAKIFLLLKLKSSDMETETEPNTLMLQFEDVNEDLLNHLSAFEGGDVADEKLWSIGVESGDQLYFHPNRFPEEYFKSLKGKYRKIYIEGM